MKYIPLLTFLISTLAIAKQDFCLVPGTALDIDVKTEVEKIGDNYSYNYTILNNKNNKLPVGMIIIETNSTPIEKSNPVGWTSKTRASNGEFKNSWINFSLDTLKPNTSVSGFKLKSSDKPGIVKLKFKGYNREPYVFSSTPYKDKSTICPGHWVDGSSAMNDPRISSVAIGPVPANYVTTNMLIRFSEKKEKWFGLIAESTEEQLGISPTTSGKIELLIPGNEIDLENLDLKSIKLGRKNITPISSRLITGLDKGLTNVSLMKNLETSKNILLEFNVNEANFLCDLDQAVFIEAKLKDGRNFLGAAALKRTPCNDQNWIHEIPKIKSMNTSIYN